MVNLWLTLNSVWKIKKVLDFHFQYWDAEECCRVAVALESLNDIEDSVFLIPIVDDTFKILEVNGDG